MGATNPISNPPKAVPGTIPEHTKAKLQAAARDFESLFVGYMLKTMRQTTSTDEMFGESFGGDILDGLFDMELARQMSKNSSVGIAEMLYRKMTGESLPNTAPAVRAPKSALPVNAPAPGAVTGSGTAQPVDNASATKEAAANPSSVNTQTAKPTPKAAEPQPQTVRPKKGIAGRLTAYEAAIREAAEKHNLDPNLIRAVIASESAGNARAQSSKNAKGLMQLIDSTATDMGATNIWDPRENILAGAKYLQQLLNRFGGDVDTALASYNAGPGAVEKHGGIPPFKETKEYVQKVKNYLQHFQQLEGDVHDDE